ncbi:MAG: hypothetical protein PHX34_04540 [Candidatus Shapirobacteria bacterium]|nr:hypothetical protein [Candidatus Shapirobacteria bacterium]
MEKEKDVKYKILLLENYNLLGEPVEKCTSLTKKGLVCGKICKFVYNGQKSCKVHLPKGEVYKEIKDKLVASYSIQELALIVLTKLDNIVKDNLELFENIDKILIEKQPKVNQKMQIISHLILGKFTEILKEQKTKIKFVSASKKGILFDGKDSNITGTLKGTKGYSNRKNASIEYGTRFLNSDKLVDSDIWRLKVDSFIKFDDINDCICYCITEFLDKEEIKQLKTFKRIKNKNRKK